MKGICIDASVTTVLNHGETYYLFENGNTHFYVSRFNNKNAHLGCYKKDLFEVIEDEKEPSFDHVPLLDKEKVYAADLIWRKPGYSFVKLKTYFLKLRKTHAYFYADERLTDFRGCFPLNWFDNFAEIEIADEDPKGEIEEPEMLPIEEWEQLRLC